MSSFQLKPVSIRAVCFEARLPVKKREGSSEDKVSKVSDDQRAKSSISLLRRLGVPSLAILTGLGGFMLGRASLGESTSTSSSGDVAAPVVTEVHDGDTFTLSNGMKVRLTGGVDALELKQPFGTQAQAYLAELIAGKAVKLQCDDVSYDRNLCTAWVDDPSTPETAPDLEVNLAMVASGWAFLDPRYKDSNPRLAEYEAAQDQAKVDEEGVCGEIDGCGQRPWAFRCDIRPTDSCLAIRE
jgi:endonuclease YncB( thermonuclease family)